MSAPREHARQRRLSMPRQQARQRQVLDTLVQHAVAAEPPVLDDLAVRQMLDGAMRVPTVEDLDERTLQRMLDRAMKHARSAERARVRSEHDAERARTREEHDADRARTREGHERAVRSEDYADRASTSGELEITRRMPKMRGHGVGRLRLSMIAACAATLAAIVWFVPHPSSSSPELLRVALPTGDRLVGTNGARFDIDELSPTTRRFHLRAGTMLFDVAHVTPGQRFEVATQDFVVVATGTVFSVTSDTGAARVHVYEGRVEIIQRERAGTDIVQHERIPLRAGVTWTRAPAKFAIPDPPELRLVAERAVSERGTEQQFVASDGVRRIVSADAMQQPTLANPPERSSPTKAKDHLAKPATVDVAKPSTVEPPPSVARARRFIGDGKLALALTEAQRAASRGEVTGEWYLVRADALRGLGRAREAAEAFNIAARKLEGTEQIEAAYSSAYLRFHELHDATAALAVLQSFDIDAQGSLLEERGLALHAQVLVALDRRDEAKELARRYLERFQHGGLYAYMKSLLRE